MKKNSHHCGRTRRSFLVDTGMGFTGLALSAMLSREGKASELWTPPDGFPHSKAKAKSVIWIFLCGGVSHLESFDVKPELNKYAGKSIEETPYKGVLDPKKVEKDIVGGNPAHGNRKVIMPLQTGFKKYGEFSTVARYGDWSMVCPAYRFRAGLGSKLSRWLTPPSMKNQITLFARGVKCG